MKTFLFYDVETSGLNPAFDQILTFAGIRTDLSLNEINRQSFTIRLRRDIIPSPKAFLTHGLTYSDLALGTSEYEAALKIHRIINTPETISVGYNSLNFDDEFLRFMFYRNLLDPYSHQYSNGCNRMDILPITVLYRIFHPAIINWPEIDGKSTMKLDLISIANNFGMPDRAHEAMNDVEALIGLSKKLFHQQDIWNYCLNFFNKAKEELRISSINPDFQIQDRRFRVCIMISLSFGSKLNYMAPVIHLGQSRPYRNQSLWLRLDSESIPVFGNDHNPEDVQVIRKRSGDGLIILPALERYWNKIPVVSRQIFNENIKKIRIEWKKFFEYIRYHVEYKYPYIPDIDPDAALYQEGFFSLIEKKQCKLFHETGNDLKCEILNQMKSPRIKILASRIVSRNFFTASTQIWNKEYQAYLERLRSDSEDDKIKGYKGDIKLNRTQGLNELKEVKSTLMDFEPYQKKIMVWLEEYIKQI